MKSLLIVSAAAVSLTFAIGAAEAAKAPSKPRSEASLECSKQATEQGLKGKERKAFRAKCIKNYKKPA